MRVRLPVGSMAALLSLLAVAAPAMAHAGFGGGSFENRVTVPPWLVWAAGGLVVAATFAVVGAFLRRSASLAEAGPCPGFGRRPRVLRERRADRFRWGDSVGPRPLWARIAGAVLWLGLLAAAMNPATTGQGDVLVWLGGWVLLPILAYLFGDVWYAFDPFRTMADIIDHLTRSGPRLQRAGAFGVWPSTVLLLGAVGTEVAIRADLIASWHGMTTGVLLFAYTVWIGLGVWLYGAQPWLSRAEVIGRMMRAWAAVSLLRAWRARKGQALDSTTVRDGVLRLPVDSMGGVWFLVVLLLGVNYDTFLDGRLGGRLLDGLATRMPELVALAVTLLGGALLFGGIFLVAAEAMRRTARWPRSLLLMAGAAAPSLIPIAVGYHAAHNLFYLYENIPRLLWGLFDPFGLGWLARLIPADTLTVPLSDLQIGLTQMAFILAGHVAAVFVAHERLGILLPSRIQALRAEIPLTVAMVLYTWIGLWLVGQPPATGAEVLG